MLVVHPSSRCDVCLDGYSDKSPHAISCGHIFCHDCLSALSPSSCPLCRKNFQPDRVKKLHVDQPDTASESGTAAGNEASVLLQRLALVSGENTPEDDVVEVMEEVDAWLATQPDDLSSNKPLRCALSALRRYGQLRELHDQEKAHFKEKQRRYHHAKRHAEHDLQTSKAVEESLLAKLEDLQEDYSIKLAKAEADLVNLRAELSKYRSTHNPLPPPPEPLPTNMFPPMMPIYPIVSSFSEPPLGGNAPVINSHLHLARKNAENNSQNIMSTKAPVVVAPKPLHAVGPRFDPDALPSQSAGPSPPQVEDYKKERRKRRESLSVSPVNDRQTTRRDRERSDLNHPRRDYDREDGNELKITTATQPITISYSADGSLQSSFRMADGRDPIASASAYVMGYAESRNLEPASYMRGYAPGYHDGHVVASSDSPQEPPIGSLSLGLSGVPPSTLRSEPTTIVDAAHSGRRLNDGIDNGNVRPAPTHSSMSVGSYSLLAAPTTGNAPRTGPPRNVSQILGLDADADEPSRPDSASSWGTVDENVNTNPRELGSISDLGLMDLRGVSTVTGNRHASRSGPRNSVVNPGDESDARTPRVRAGTISGTVTQPPISLSYVQDAEMNPRSSHLPPGNGSHNGRSRHSRSTSHPDVPVQVSETRERPSEMRRMRTERAIDRANERSADRVAEMPRDRRRSVQFARAEQIIPPSIISTSLTSNGTHFPPALQTGASVSSNALALSFNDSSDPNGNDDGIAAQHIGDPPSWTLHAPTPIMSTLSSWRLRAS